MGLLLNPPDRSATQILPPSPRKPFDNTSTDSPPQAQSFRKALDNAQPSKKPQNSDKKPATTQQASSDKVATKKSPAKDKTKSNDDSTVDQQPSTDEQQNATVTSDNADENPDTNDEQIADQVIKATDEKPEKQPQSVQSEDAVTLSQLAAAASSQAQPIQPQTVKVETADASNDNPSDAAQQATAPKTTRVSAKVIALKTPTAKPSEKAKPQAAVVTEAPEAVAKVDQDEQPDGTSSDADQSDDSQIDSQDAVAASAAKQDAPTAKKPTASLPQVDANQPTKTTLKRTAKPSAATPEESDAPQVQSSDLSSSDAAPSKPAVSQDAAEKVDALKVLQMVDAPKDPTSAIKAPPPVAPRDQPPAPAPESDFAQSNHDRMVTSMRSQLLPGGGTMQLRLDPPELGVLQINVRMVDGAMTASFETSNDQATRLLSHSLGQLKQALETQGVSVEKLHVQQTPQNQQGKSSSDDQKQQQTERDGSSARQQQQRREMLRRMWRRLRDGSDPLDTLA